ncbi:ribonuclease D [Wenzhouxiangella sp. XN201]|uniref:ribonuclease D n=1 Tax=Wenzhouxiangella sp. XN201 TaxID=2710755 RepID=UPI0013CAF2D2|nr:HRDC domain-containing protein [Wenzhouxiangella sp. XN201]NEZ04220.1 ribonuclease D [Wenzhouxiangella sp. XN201]
MNTPMPCRKPAEARTSAAAAAIDDAELVTEEVALERAADCWDAHQALGIDTEFVRERTFHARPGLIQISSGDQAWLLDPVALPRMPRLGRMLADANVTKVLHSVGEDLDVLYAVGGVWPQPLFDTQVAAAMIGMPLQCRYENLVEAAFGVELAGGKARSDWCRRPLTAGLLRYAAEDVVWLPDLKFCLEQALERVGRLDWHREDCNRIVEAARAGDTTPPLSRVKGAGRLETRELAVLNALADWRETAARQRDLPRRFVLSDETLIEMARSTAGEGPDQAIEALGERQRRRHEVELRDLLASVDASAFERPPWLDPLTPAQRTQLKQAQQVVRGLAAELGIDAAVIASKKELTRLIRGERPDWLDGWRGTLLAGQLEEASVSISPPSG